MGRAVELLDSANLQCWGSDPIDPRPHRHETTAQILDLGLACRGFDDGDPLGEDAPIKTLAVPRTVEPFADPKYIRAPRRPPGAAATTYPSSRRISAPRARSPLRWMSTGRTPMTQPPGSETRASRRRASSGPSTVNEPRIVDTNS